MIKRREFIAGLGSAAAWPIAAWAQQADRVRRIGVLMGWTDGRNVRMDVRWGGGDINRSRALAQELVGLQPDIIVTGGLPATVAVRRETPTIPIVFMNVGDPSVGGIVPRLDARGDRALGPVM
jgi:putative ABC transport system substrate-binding protein